jgi:hypothetical protein
MIKVENTSGRERLPRGTKEKIEKIIDSIPKEHLRGLDRLRLVDSIKDPRIKSISGANMLPGLYHPKQGTKAAWIEVALDVVLPQDAPLHKRLLPRLSFKANLATVIFSLVGQHHYMTLRHSVKRGQLEASVRAYTEKQLKRWNESEHSFRSRLFRPIQPSLERWARALQRRARKERKKV